MKKGTSNIVLMFLCNLCFSHSPPECDKTIVAASVKCGHFTSKPLEHLYTISISSLSQVHCANALLYTPLRPLRTPNSIKTCSHMLYPSTNPPTNHLMHKLQNRQTQSLCRCFSFSIKTCWNTSFDLSIGYQAHTPDASSTSGLIVCNTMLLKANIIWLAVTTVSKQQ